MIAAGYQGNRNIGRQWLTPDIHDLEGHGFTALDDKDALFCFLVPYALAMLCILEKRTVVLNPRYLV